MNNNRTLVELCLNAVCQNLDGFEHLSNLPDYLRQKILQHLPKTSAAQNLRYLSLANCKHMADDEMKTFSSLQNLTKLNLTRCENLNGMGLFSLAKLPNLTWISLNHCTKISLGVSFLQTLPNLKYLDLSFCELQDPVMLFISSLRQLSHLNLMCNRVTDEGTTHIANLTQLVYLNISMNPLVTDKTMETLSQITTLTSLNVNFCKLLTGEGIFNATKKLTNLKNLEITGCDRAVNESKARPRVLLAEDNKFQAQMIAKVLHRYNFDVEVAANGEIALEMFRKHPKYDLILMDLAMPIMDGPSCVKEIREHEQMLNLKRTPIIIQTADPEEHQRRICFEAGCDEFMTKPLDKSCISLAKSLMQTR